MMKQNNIMKVFNAIAPIKKAKVDNTGTAILDLPTWVGYTFGPLFILLGIIVLTFYKQTKEKAEFYKKRQLEQYNKDTGKNVANYESTKLFLPPWEKIKLSLPIFLGLTLIFIGIAWIVGNALSTKNF